MTATKVDAGKTKSKAPASSGATNLNLGPAFGECAPRPGGDSDEGRDKGRAG